MHIINVKSSRVSGLIELVGLSWLGRCKVNSCWSVILWRFARSRGKKIIHLLDMLEEKISVRYSDYRFYSQFKAITSLDPVSLTSMNAISSNYLLNEYYRCSIKISLPANFFCFSFCFALSWINSSDASFTEKKEC